MRCSVAPAARQERPALPVLQWISGWTRTMWMPILDAHSKTNAMRPRTLVLLSLLFALPLFAGRQRAVRHPSPAPAVTGPTFSNEVVRIFQQHCQSCHHAGDIAPFPLVSYEDAKAN